MLCYKENKRTLPPTACKWCTCQTWRQARVAIQAQLVGKQKLWNGLFWSNNFNIYHTLVRVRTTNNSGDWGRSDAKTVRRPTACLAGSLGRCDIKTNITLKVYWFVQYDHLPAAILNIWKFSRIPGSVDFRKYRVKWSRNHQNTLVIQKCPVGHL